MRTKKSNLFYFLGHDNWVVALYLLPPQCDEVDLTIVLLRQSMPFTKAVATVLAFVAKHTNLATARTASTFSFLCFCILVEFLDRTFPFGTGRGFFGHRLE